MYNNYEELIKFARSCNRTKNHITYYEWHHILPRSMGGDDSDSNLVLLTVAEHVEAHYLLALKYENENRQWYYANLNAAWLVCHGKSIFTKAKRREVEKWLSDPEAQAFTLKLKEQLRGAKHPERKNFDAYKYKKRIWVCKGTQKPLRILESSKNTNYYKSFTIIPDCPICHNSNSETSFACCKEHEEQYILQKKQEYKTLKAEQTRESWTRPEDRELRIKNSLGKNTEKGRFFWVTNGLEDIQIFKGEDIPDGYIRGRSKNIPTPNHTEESKRKQSEHRKNCCYVWRDDVSCKEIQKSELDEYLSQGWHKGRKPGTVNRHKGFKQPKMAWVNKNGEILKIRADDLDKYISNGYSRGRGSKS